MYLFLVFLLLFYIKKHLVFFFLFTVFDNVKNKKSLWCFSRSKKQIQSQKQQDQNQKETKTIKKDKFVFNVKNAKNK